MRLKRFSNLAEPMCPQMRDVRLRSCVTSTEKFDMLPRDPSYMLRWSVP